MYILSQNPWNNPTDDERNALVFEQRNKAYGAYVIRSNYNHTLVRALVFSAFVILSIFLIPLISQLFAKETIDVTLKVTPVDNTPFLPKDETKPFTPEPEKTTEQRKPEITTNAWRVISDVVSHFDTLTMEDLNQLKIGVVQNPNGKPGNDDELFPDLEKAGKQGFDVIMPDDPIVVDVPEMPEFMGGNEKIYPYLSLNVNYPDAAKKDDINARVVVGFVVEKDGSISNVKILKCTEAGYGFEEEAARVIQNMPKWKPGRQNGNPARVRFHIPINFRLY